MRNAKFIDYKQLGLSYTLYRFEVIFNRALCYFQLNQRDLALAELEKCEKHKFIAEHRVPLLAPPVVEEHWRAGRIQTYIPFAVPVGLLYKPAQIKLENAEKVDYLGSSQVIASVSGDKFIGFSGPKVFLALEQLLIDDAMLFLGSKSIER